MVSPEAVAGQDPDRIRAGAHTCLDPLGLRIGEVLVTEGSEERQHGQAGPVGAAAASAFSITSLNIWKFKIHTLLKPPLENFKKYLTGM